MKRETGNKEKPTTPRLPAAAGWGTRLLFLTSLFFLMTAVAFGQSSKLSPDFKKLPSGQSTSAIVQYYTAPTTTDANYAKSAGATNPKALGLVKATRYTMTLGIAQSLITLDTNVKYVSPDRPLKKTSSTSSDSVMNVTVGANLARSLGYDGTGVGVAVIDSGVNAGPDLGVPGSMNGTRMVYSANFDTSTTTTSDLYGHGTHVAGIIAGNGASSTCSNCTITYRGIAPNANIINLRVLDVNGGATDSEVIAAIQAAISLKSTYNIRVMNLSLGRGIYESYALDPLCQSVEQAWNNGIVVVVAAGNYGRDNSNNNSGYGTITAPGNDPYVITVGAMRDMGTYTIADDVITTYSSKGPTMDDQVVKPDLVAPGNLIVSDLASASDTLYSLYPQNLVPLSTYTQGNNGNISQAYYLLSGTSMATPVVSGAAALLVQQNPSMTPDQVKARLMLTAYKAFPSSSSWTDPSTGITYNEQYDIFTVGAGYVNIYAALNSTALASTNVGAALSPTVAYDSTTNTVYLVEGSSVIWGHSLVWDNSVVWGSSVIWGTNTSGQSVLWGSSVCWGSSTTSAFSVIWGSSVIWGASDSQAMMIEINGEN
jgi:serine protease AprX